MSTKLDLDNLNSTLLKGKTVLVLGGASGLGLNTALEIAKTGALVTIADSLPHAVVVEQFTRQNLAIQYVKCDVTEWQQQVMAFKQALTFAPSRSLDVVCSFVAMNSQTDLVNEAKDAQPRIDQDPEEVGLDDLDTNLISVLDSTRLALHYFKIPPRSTVIKKVQSRLSSSSGSSRSSSGSRSPSRSPSRSNSPIPPPPPPPLESDAEVKEPPEVKQGSEADAIVAKPEPESEPKFTKTLLIATSLSAYLDDPYDTFHTTSSFALRGLFRSLRTKAEKDLNVRVNLVAPWAVRTPMMQPILKQLEQQGIISREEPVPTGDETLPAHVITGDTKLEEAKAKTQSGSSTNDQSKPAESKIEGADIATPEASEQLQPEPTQSTPPPPPPPEQPDTSVPSSTSQQPETVDAAATSEQPSASEVTSAVEVPAESNSAVVPNGQEPNEQASSSEQPDPMVEAVATTSKTDTKNDTEAIKTDPVESSPKEDPTPESVTITEPEVRYKNIEFASLQDVANTVIRLCVDSRLSGRAIAVMPEGAFDLEDDYKGGYAGEQLKKLLDMRKQAGDVWLSQSANPQVPAQAARPEEESDLVPDSVSSPSSK